MTVVSEEGAGVGIDDIARASHIAKPIFYRYFRDNQATALLDDALMLSAF